MEEFDYGEEDSKNNIIVDDYDKYLFNNIQIPNTNNDTKEFNMMNDDKINTEKFILDSMCNSNDDDPIPSLINHPKKKTIKPKGLIEDILFAINKRKNTNLEKEDIKKNFIDLYIINNNIQKHNSTPEIKNIMLINDLIESKENHFIAVFKDYLISDYQEEFLRRFFNMDEIQEIIPKFYIYYKNYLTFFCKGTFCDFDVNEIIQNYGEFQAELYYNNNYGHKERQKQKQKNKSIENENALNKDDSRSLFDNEKNNFSFGRKIFTDTIKFSIDRMVLTETENSRNNNKELSNIKPDISTNSSNSLNLPNDSKVTSNDVIFSKESSVISMINLINNNKNMKSNKKIKINIEYSNDNNKINLESNNKINTNNTLVDPFKKNIFSLSNAYSNLKVKIKNNAKKSKSNKNQYFNKKKYKKFNTGSNFKNYMGVLKNKATNKSNENKNKFSHEDSNFSAPKFDKLNKTKNFSIFSNPEFPSHLNALSTGSLNTKISKEKNKINKKNCSSFMNPRKFSFIQKGKTNITNSYSGLNQLSTSKNKKKTNSKIKKTSNSKNKSIKKENTNINNSKGYINLNQKIKTLVNSIKNVTSNNRNNKCISHIKSLSYSTVNNCNININNNIILSNNYFNHKYNLLQNKNTNHKSNSKNPNNSIGRKSRNVQNDLSKFKTESNLLYENSLTAKTLISKHNSNNLNNNNNQYKSFRNSNKELFFKSKHLDKSKKEKNLSIKNIPVTVKKGNIILGGKNINSNRAAKFFEGYENITSFRTFKKNVGKNESNPKKIIFDYKGK